MTLALPFALARTRDVVEPAMRAAVDRLDPTSARIARYHFGWTDADGRPVNDNGGKAVRPALALLSAAAVHADDMLALPGAVAVECVHNFSLLHDDLMDGDVERRHRPTVWSLWGASAAILVGDALLTLAQQVLADSGLVTASAAIDLLGAATQELIRGQFADLDFEQRRDVALGECIAMAEGKTGALLACSAAIGATLAGADRSRVDALAAYGMHIGVAFQLVDDLLGIWGDPARTGKPVGSDLRARKKSLPVTYAANAGGPASEELASWLATEGPDSDAAVQRAAGLVETAGGRAWAAEEARRRLAAAVQSLDPVSLAAPARDELVALARFVVDREA
jgi:geranylgeranyl diphosphate synthase type I